MKTEKTLAIVLRRTDFGEADRIVTLLTSEGKISAIARGARRQKSKLAGGIEIFAVNEIVLVKGKSDLRTIVSARMREFFGEILKDFDRTDFAYQAIKTISNYAENVDNPDFYKILKITLASLNDSAILLSIVKAWFSLNSTIALGVQVNLSVDNHGEKLAVDKKYNFDEINKVFVESGQGEFDSSHIKILRFMSVAKPKNIANIKDISRYIIQISQIVKYFN